ncbi:MAG TPA: hypothetical protein PKD64_11570 [Pirellulaceae bacterium]|nr:hypothetical protein [Pirellulaceae bacterium]HMO92822.1 hypothetical protein [Pirellulaceae bacterium]HMP69435.1 hypothetical protein [Pirellulaceae bacterium]
MSGACTRPSSAEDENRQEDKERGVQTGRDVADTADERRRVDSEKSISQRNRDGLLPVSEPPDERGVK